MPDAQTAENPRPLALIVDDEADIRELLEITLARMEIDVICAADVASTIAALNRHRFDLCLTDMRLPDGSGIDILHHLAERAPDVPAAVITAHGNVEAAVESLKAGAFDFVSKPVDLGVLRNLVNRALRIDGGRETTPAEPESSQRLLGESGAMLDVRRKVAKLARSQAPVLITGESGVGKELAARMIHDGGPRSDGPFVPVNCGAIPSELMESEFFGHRKGSFTGAVSDKDGLFDTANGGTLFLDEVAELPLHMQVKLLRVIQEKSVRAVGANREHSIDVRVLSATHRDLMTLVDEGQFRQDLYYRINVIELRMPSLRERPDDVLKLADHFLKRICAEWGIACATLSRDAQAALSGYEFPGNVRELENVLERAITMADADRIEASDLLLEGRRDATAPTRFDRGDVPLEEFITGIEREAIVRALEATHYNKTAAARKLGISFRALRYRLKKLDLE